MSSNNNNTQPAKTAEIESAREQITHPTPFTFLSLAPTTSNSYPRARTASSRSSSTSSGSDSGSGSARDIPAGMKYLKLGPVHNGEHLGEDRGDWHQLRY